MKKKILVVEDDANIVKLLGYNLSKEGYDVDTATSGTEALKKSKEKTYDLVVLDCMIPEIDGLEVCRSLKKNEKTADIPVIFLTAKGEESDVIVGLELGADDYITKPFSTKVLLARIRAALRRNKKEEDDAGITGRDESVLKVHGIEIDLNRHAVTVKGKRVDLTATEFSILCFLAKRPGWVFSREQIIDSIKGDNYIVTDRTIDVHVFGLRKKLGKSGDYIESIRSVGYRIKE